MSDTGPSVVALIPARSGSKRVPGKNIRPLAGHPLIAYSIASAVESGIFSQVVVSTDSEEIADITRYYGAETPFLRPAEYSGDASPDIEFVEHALATLREQGREYECFSILRATSPFRKAETIRRAWKEFLSQNGVDSLRAVERCATASVQDVGGARQPHDAADPLRPSRAAVAQQPSTLPCPRSTSRTPAWRSRGAGSCSRGGTIAGNVLMPFMTHGDEGLDVNTEYDWMLAELMVERGDATLPPVPVAHFKPR